MAHSAIRIILSAVGLMWWVSGSLKPRAGSIQSDSRTRCSSTRAASSAVVRPASTASHSSVSSSKASL